MIAIARLLPLIVALPLLLGGCGAAMKQRIEACKIGDWTQIGKTDGLEGAPPTFADRKDFCDDHGDDKKPAAADAGARYTAGWEQGNREMWSAVGAIDGKRGLQQSQYAVRAAGEEVRKRKTPLNQPAYDEGWFSGNSQYWEDIGRSEGADGKPLTRKEASRAQAATAQLRFDEAAYTNGWHAGNRTFWQQAGLNDARDGIPDSRFRDRAAAARDAGVQVQEEVYRAAWNAEILNYWRNLGAQDAVSGKDFAVRAKEARQKGLKVFESEYRQAWEKRLADHWRQAGAEDGYGKPFMLEERVASAARDGVFVIASTRDIYTKAWEEQNAKYCVPENAFERGRANSGMAVEVCRRELRDQLKRAYVSGQDFEVAGIKYRQAVSDANDMEARLYDIRGRLSRLDRDMRSAPDTKAGAKDNAANEENKKQDRRREQERRELIDYARRLEWQLDEARHWIERLDLQMQSLRRNIY
jgi:hypothetical protein